MAGLTAYLENAFIASIRNAGNSPPTLYVALFTTAPTDAYTAAVPDGTEVSGGSYAKTAAAFTAPSGAPQQIANSALVTFPTATASWGTIVAAGIFDRNSGTQNLLGWALLASPITVASGDVIQFQAGAITITMD